MKSFKSLKENGMGEVGEAEKTGKYKVDMLMKKLNQPAISKYLINITKPMDQAEAIVQFAELIGVPKSRLPYIMKQMKLSAAGQGQPDMNMENAERPTTRLSGMLNTNSMLKIRAR